MTYGNLAYKYDYPNEKHNIDIPSRDKRKADARERETVKVRPARKSGIGARNAASERKSSKREIGYFGKICCVLTVTIAAIFMIMQFAEVSRVQSELAEAESDYDFELSVTAQKNFELEQSIDLSKIEKEATTRLGMRRPEKYQTVYIDVKQDDVTEKTADEVEGLGNRTAQFFSSLIGNIVDFFSI